jgi:CRISPR-associated protein Cas4
MTDFDTRKTPAQGELPLHAPPAARDETLVPARMINEWLYCPRLAYLEWAQGEWAGNADTAAGKRAHRGSDKGRAPALPAPEALEEKPFKTRRLPLASETLGLVAEIDALEAEDGLVVPVDTKVGKRPHVAEGAYLPERAQVCVQGLLLREAGYRCEEGALWFAESRERVRVPLDEALVATTLRRLRAAAGARFRPDAAAARRLAEMPALLAAARLPAGRGELVPQRRHAAHAAAAREPGPAGLCASPRRAHRQEGRDARRRDRGRGEARRRAR